MSHSDIDSRLTSSSRTLGEASSDFGHAWSRFKDGMAGDEHVPQIEGKYVQPMVASQLELIEALEEFQKAVRHFDKVREDADAELERMNRENSTR